MQRCGYKVAHVHIPGAGDDLHGLGFAHVKLADVHMVGIGVLLHGEHAPDLYVPDRGGEVLRDLHLGAGDGHRLVKVAVAYLAQRQIHELGQPFSG